MEVPEKKVLSKGSHLKGVLSSITVLQTSGVFLVFVLFPASPITNHYTFFTAEVVQEKRIKHKKN